MEGLPDGAKGVRYRACGGIPENEPVTVTSPHPNMSRGHELISRARSPL